MEPAITILDVRPLLARREDPLATILAALEKLPAQGVLVVEAPFRPAPLLRLLGESGHGVFVEAVGARHWIVEAVKSAGVTIEDLRDLEPPEPLERVLRAASALKPRGVYLARLPRAPRLLMQELQRRGFPFSVGERSDGAAIVRVDGPE